MKRRAGFTLTEVWITVIILGILFTIAVMTYEAIRKKAVATEAVTALGVIRRAVEAYYAEEDTYKYRTTTSYTQFFSLLRLELDEFNGEYFSEECYRVTPISVPGKGTMYLAACASKYSTAPKASLVKGWGGYIVVDYNGNIYTTIPGLGYPPPPSLISSWLSGYGIT